MSSSAAPATPSLLGPSPSSPPTIYVGNIPPSWTSADVYKAFHRIQPIKEVYIPLKPNRRGVRYGFLHTSSSTNVEDLLSRINEMSLGQYKVHASLSLRSRKAKLLSSTRPRLHSKPPFIPSLRDHRSYAEILQPHLPATSQAKASAPVLHQPSLHSAHKRIPLPAGVTSQPTRQQQKITHRDAGTFQDFVEDTVWLDSCLVARVLQLDKLGSLPEAFAEQGVFSVFICPLVGDNVLLSFDCRSQRDYFLEERRSWLDQWFFSIRPWQHHASIDASSRFVWLRLHGVPLELWSEDFFRWVSAHFGAFVLVDEATLNRSRLDVARILVSTACNKVIHSSLSFTYDACSYCIFAGEDPCSNWLNGHDFRSPERVVCSPEVDCTVESLSPAQLVADKTLHHKGLASSPVPSPSVSPSPFFLASSSFCSSSFSSSSSASSRDSPAHSLSSGLIASVPPLPARSFPEDPLAVTLCARRWEFELTETDLSPLNCDDLLEWTSLDLAATCSPSSASLQPCLSPLAASAEPSVACSQLGPLEPRGLCSTFSPFPPCSAHSLPPCLPLILSQPSPCLPPSSPSRSAQPSPSRHRLGSGSSSSAGVPFSDSSPLPRLSLPLSSPLPRRPRKVRVSRGARRSRVVSSARVVSSSAPFELEQPSDSDIMRMNTRHRLLPASAVVSSPSSEAIATAEVGIRLGFSFPGDPAAVIAAISDQVVEETRLWGGGCS